MAIESICFKFGHAVEPEASQYSWKEFDKIEWGI